MDLKGFISFMGHLWFFEKFGDLYIYYLLKLSIFTALPWQPHNRFRLAHGGGAFHALGGAKVTVIDSFALANLATANAGTVEVDDSEVTVINSK